MKFRNSLNAEAVGAEEQDVAAKQEQLVDLKSQVEKELLHKVLSTYAGRRVLFNIIAKGDIYDQDGQMPFDLAQSQRCIGRREIAVEILKDCLNAIPDVYITMQNESGDFERKFELNELTERENDE